MNWHKPNIIPMNHQIYCCKKTITMPLFDPATIIAFFTGAQLMALTKDSFFQLTEEEIDTPEDLKEFMKDRLKTGFHLV